MQRRNPPYDLTANKHARDTNVIFNEENHTYHIRGYESETFTSVTTFIKSLFKAFDGPQVVEKHYHSWQADLDNKYYGMTKVEILQSWETNGLNAATLGTSMHKNIENYYLDRPYHTDTEEWARFQAFESWYSKLSPAWLPYGCERMVYHEELKLAGCLDMLFIDSEGKYILCDWKRCKEMRFDNRYAKGIAPCTSNLADCNYIHYSIQLMMYGYILRTKYNIDVSQMFIVNFHPNEKEFARYKVYDSPEVINSIVAHRINSINTMPH